jgi:hypothetical protein
MRSPFPGMDPFWEAKPQWPVLHGWLIRELCRISLPKAQELGYLMGVERSIYFRLSNGEVALLGEPDLFAEEVESSRKLDHPAGGLAVAEPKAVHKVSMRRRGFKQDYLVVKESRRPNPIVAVVEILSPGNKRGSYGRKYREKRQRFLDSAVNFLEIDLLRAGCSPARDLFPELAPTPYFIYLARKHGATRHDEAFPLKLPESLPVIGLPLGGRGSPILPLDLPTAFRAAMELAEGSEQLNYSLDEIPLPALTDADAEFVKQVFAERTR